MIGEYLRDLDGFKALNIDKNLFTKILIGPGENYE